MHHHSHEPATENPGLFVSSHAQGGQELVEENCTRCHTLAIIGVSSKTAHEWYNTVYRMEKLGANVSDDEVDAIVDYLATHYGPSVNVP